MESTAASRCLDLFVVLSLLPPFISATRIITDTPDLQKSTSTGKHTETCARVRGPRGTLKTRVCSAEQTSSTCSRSE